MATHDHHSHAPESVTPPTPFDPAHESLSNALRTGFNLLRVIIVILLAAYFLSGAFLVGPGEQGVVVRLGKLRVNEAEGTPFAGSNVFGPGWHISLPDPFDEKILIPGQSFTLEVDTFLFNRRPGDVAKAITDALPTYEELDPVSEGTMITGDRGLAHGLWTVNYRIVDAGKFVAGMSTAELSADPRDKFAPLRRNLEELLTSLLESAVVRTVAGLPVERVAVSRVGAGGADFAIDVQQKLGAALDEFDLGIVIDKVTAETVEPGAVRDSFLDVTRAQSERDQSIRAAESERAQILSKAAGTREEYEPLLTAITEYAAAQTMERSDIDLAERLARIDEQLTTAGGQVAAELRAAQSRASSIRQRFAQEYEAFSKLRQQYDQYPRKVAVQLWVDMRNAILGSKQNELFFIARDGDIEILTNRDEEKLIEQDVEAFRQPR